MIDTPQGPGRIKQLNILKNSVIAVVEGPGESLQYVEVALPEPVVPEGAAGGGCPGCAKRRTIVGSGDEAASASAEEAEGARHGSMTASSPVARATLSRSRRHQVKARGHDHAHAAKNARETKPHDTCAHHSWKGSKGEGGAGPRNS